MLERWQALVLGLIQGITEFLPVSSTGHMKLFQLIYSLEDTPLVFDIMLHVGTLIAVVVVYWRDIWYMLCHPIKSDLKLLVLATVPAVPAALLFGDFLEGGINGWVLGVSFLMTCAVLLLAEGLSKIREHRRNDVNWKDAIIMGIAQAVAAILPGLSRSGSTISGGLISGLNRRSAADFAFLMSIPAILGSAVMGLKDIYSDAAAASVSFGTQFGALIDGLGGASSVIIGIVAAAVSGFIAIKVMLKIVRKANLRWFALYTGLLGGIVIVWEFTRTFMA